MDPLKVERSIVIAAPRERVWQALITPDQIVQWLVPNLPGAMMKSDDAGKITVFLGEMGVDFITLEQAEPVRRAVMLSLPDQRLPVAYTLDDQNDGTRVTVTMSGLEVVSEETRQHRMAMTGAGWEKTLQNLQAYLKGAALPHPQAYVAPLFGCWYEPRKTLAVERSIWMKATRERVWKAVTDPAQIQAWVSPNTAWQLSALEVGGRFFVRNAETGGEMYVEVIERLEPPFRLITRCLPEPPDTVVKTKVYTLTDENGGTRMTLIYSGYEPAADGAHWRQMEENTFGFGMMLQNAKAYVESLPLPFPWGF